MLLFSAFYATSINKESEDSIINYRDKAESLSRSNFIRNEGQLNSSEILYYSGGGNLYFTPNSMFYRSREVEQCKKNVYDPDFLFNPRIDTNKSLHELGVVIKYSFIGSNNIIPTGMERCDWNTNFFIGNVSEKWHRNVPNYKKIEYKDLWNNIDFYYYYDQNGIKYDIILNPGADPNNIRIKIEGHESLSLTDKGDLLIRTKYWDIIDSGIYAYYNDNTMSNIKCTFSLITQDVYSFSLNNYDREREVVIDPLIYSTFIGGCDEDGGTAIALDKDGNIFTTGYAETDYPTSIGAFDRTFNYGIGDVFITKLDPTGSSLVYSTYIGGNDYDCGLSITIDTNGCSYVTGFIKSKDFPMINGSFDTTQNGDFDAFIIKINNTGSSIILSTYLGGKGSDYGKGIAIDTSENIIITGNTNSSNYPVSNNAYDNTYNGNWMDAFLTKLDSNGSFLLFSTFIGGTKMDYSTSVTLDQNKNIYLTGFTESWNFPVTSGSFDTTYNGLMDVFVSKFDPFGINLIFSTFIGGKDHDLSRAITLDQKNDVYITGSTGQYFEAYGDFPTTEGAYDTTFNGYLDIFVTKLDKTGSYLIYSTLIGGNDQEQGNGISLDPDANAYITGETVSIDFPVTKGADDVSYNGDIEAYALKLSANGSELEYSTYLGGGKRDGGYGIVVDNDRFVYVVGDTFYDPNLFPVTDGAYDTTHNGAFDVFVLKLNMTNDNIKPVFGQDLSDGNATTGDRFGFEIEVTDYVGVSVVYVQFRFGNGTIINRSMSGTGPYLYDIIIPTHSIEPLYYIFRARDLAGNWANTTEKTVPVKDNDGPEFISDLTPSNASTGEPFKFIVSVSDNIAISSVHVEYRFGIEFGYNSTMSLSKENFFLDIEIPLNYSELFYRFSVVDNSSNWNSTIEKRVDVFDLFPPVFIRDLTLNQIGTGEELTFTVEVQDNMAVSSVYVEYWTNADVRMNISLVGSNIFTHELTVPLNSTDTINYCFHACDPEGNWANLSGSVAVIDIISPTAEFSMNSYYNEDESILLDGSRSYDNIGITDWIWMIDGPVRSATLHGERVYHTFLDPGDHFITLKALDLARNWDIKTVNISIDDITLPIANAGKDLTVPEGTEVVFNSSGSEDNVGIAESRWIFFDKMERVLYGPTPTYVFDDPGVFEITLTVADAAGNTGTDNLTVMVRDITPPTADAGSDQTVFEGTVVILNGTNSTDNVVISNWIWTIHLKDREVALYETVVSFNFTEPGNYSVTLTVKDGSGNSGSDNATITVILKEIPPDDDNGKTGPRYGYLLVSLLLLIIITCSLVLFLVIRKRRKSHDQDLERYYTAE
jgi:hypothetical protein